VFGALFEESGCALQQDIAQRGPILGVRIDDDCGAGVGQNVPDAPQPRRETALGLDVDYRIERTAGHRVTDRDHVRASVGVGGRQMGDTVATQGAADTRNRHASRGDGRRQARYSAVLSGAVANTTWNGLQ